MAQRKTYYTDQMIKIVGTKLSSAVEELRRKRDELSAIDESIRKTDSVILKNGQQDLDARKVMAGASWKRHSVMIKSCESEIENYENCLKLHDNKDLEKRLAAEFKRAGNQNALITPMHECLVEFSALDARLKGTPARYMSRENASKLIVSKRSELTKLHEERILIERQLQEMNTDHAEYSSDISILQQAITTSENIRLLAAEELKVQQQAKAGYEESRKQLLADIGKLETKISKHKSTFAYSYLANPGELLSALRQAVKKAMQEYALSLRYEPKIHVDLALKLIDDFNRYLDDKKSEFDERCLRDGKGATEEQEFLGLQLKQLSGFIWHICDAHQVKDAYFSEILLEAMGDEAIEAETAKAEADKIKLPEIGLPPATIKAYMREIRQIKYQDAYQRLNDKLNEALPGNAHSAQIRFHASAKNLLQQVHDSDMANKLMGARVLNAAYELYMNPTNTQASTKLSDLVATRMNGYPSTSKKILGALVMFLGASLVLLSIGFGVLSAGMAAPAVIAGITIGAGVFASGAALCAHGRAKGVVKAINDDVKAANRYKLFLEKPEKKSTGSLAGILFSM